MKLKKILAVAMTCVLAFSFIGCGSKKGSDADTTPTTGASGDDSAAVTGEADGSWSYSSIKLGEDYTDLTATIKWIHHRTDRDSNAGGDGKLQEYIAKFNELYPNITVETEGVTDYANESLLRLSTGDWGDIMMIPAVDKGDFATYFLPYGTSDEISAIVNYTTDKTYDGKVYGIPYMAGANGIVYNKAVFEAAGITTIPTTPDEFIAALKQVKEKTDAIPLYTNYFAQWTMGAWDAYMGAVSTGDFAWYNQELPHTAAPFADPGDGTGAYNVFKVLYDAVANDLIEDDYTTTDWEGSKGMINRGEIATMVLGSWAYSQMQAAGDNPDDIGYMPFPITINGKQYAVAAPDYNFGINVNSSEDNQIASTIFVKWMTEESGWSYNEGGLPIDKDGQLPDLYQAFANCEMKEQDPAIAGEETLLNDLNAESELNINNGGNDKVMKIIENADTGAKSFDDLMGEWNKAWSDAQTALGVEVKY
jgi:ABC-type glycerol-3-phosphate transport system substrate-binding protein